MLSLCPAALQWIACDKCQKWRVIPAAHYGKLQCGAKWDCTMNSWDPPPPRGVKPCDVPEPDSNAVRQQAAQHARSPAPSSAASTDRRRRGWHHNSSPRPTPAVEVDR